MVGGNGRSVRDKERDVIPNGLVASVLPHAAAAVAKLAVVALIVEGVLSIRPLERDGIRNTPARESV
jgi:hypothetical protein